MKNKAQKSKPQRMEQKRQFWSVINTQIQEEVQRIGQHQDVFDGELKNSIPYGKERVDRITVSNNFPSPLKDMSEAKRQSLNTTGRRPHKGLQHALRDRSNEKCSPMPSHNL